MTDVNTLALLQETLNKKKKANKKVFFLLSCNYFVLNEDNIY